MNGSSSKKICQFRPRSNNSKLSFSRRIELEYRDRSTLIPLLTIIPIPMQRTISMILSNEKSSPKILKLLVDTLIRKRSR